MQCIAPIKKKIYEILGYRDSQGQQENVKKTDFPFTFSDLDATLSLTLVERPTLKLKFQIRFVYSWGASRFRKIILKEVNPSWVTMLCWPTHRDTNTVLFLVYPWRFEHVSRNAQCVFLNVGVASQRHLRR